MSVYQLSFSATFSKFIMVSSFAINGNTEDYGPDPAEYDRREVELKHAVCESATATLV